MNQLKISLQRLAKIFKFSLVVCENARDRNFTTAAQNSIIVNLIYIINFLYRLMSYAHSENLTNAQDEVYNTLKNIIVFLLIVVDFLNNRYNTFNSLSEGKPNLPPNSTALQTNFNLISFEMFKSFLNINNEPLITSSVIKQWKLKEFQGIEYLINSKEWTFTFIDNPKVLALLDKNYGDSYAVINSNVLKNIQKQESLQT